EPNIGTTLVETAKGLINEYLIKIGVPNKQDYVFSKWEPTHNNYLPDELEVVYKMLNDEYVPIWESSMISVTVPTNAVPFQVVTNLMDKDADPFIAGVLNIKNNSTTRALNVSVERFNDVTVQPADQDTHKLELIDPNTPGIDWDTLSGEDAIKKMALGLYVKDGVAGRPVHTKENPLWIKPGFDTKTELGIIPPAESKNNPYEAKLSFTAKHAKPENFIGGRAKGKFELVFIFE
ncbi:MAG: hypothetical protein SPK28_06160, partial [Bacilli bacterium]|nr:hypothetical protein [Bacilli bacterium]